MKTKMPLRACVAISLEGWEGLAVSLRVKRGNLIGVIGYIGVSLRACVAIS